MVTLRQMETHAGLDAYSCGAIKAAFRDIVGVQFRNGATLEISGVTASQTVPEFSMTVEIGTVTMTDRGDGTVEVVPAVEVVNGRTREGPGADALARRLDR